MNSIDRDLDLLYEIGSLRNVPRGWAQHFGPGQVATVLEHTIRVAYLALIIARREKFEDEELVLKMALSHDLAETRTSDHSYVQKIYVKADEEAAVEQMLAGTSLQDFTQIIQRYDERELQAAKIVKDADNLEVDLELQELKERGHQLVAKKMPNRQLVRDTKLYTDTARELWDAIQASDPSRWHLQNNKWLRLPDAGK